MTKTMRKLSRLSLARLVRLAHGATAGLHAPRKNPGAGTEPVRFLGRTVCRLNPGPSLASSSFWRSREARHAQSSPRYQNSSRAGRSDLDTTRAIPSDGRQRRIGPGRAIIGTVREAMSMAGKAAFASVGLLVAPATYAQEPNWDYVSGVMLAALSPEDGAGVHVADGVNGPGYITYMATAGASQVEVRIHDGFFQNPASAAEQVARAWAAQPAVFRQAAMPRTISIDPIFWAAYVYDNRFQVILSPAYLRHHINGSMWRFEETMTHEMCHALDHRKGYLSQSAEWRDLIARDGSYVSNYARTSNLEDFAESCTAHVLLAAGGHRLDNSHRNHVLATMRNRAAYLNELIPLPGAVDDYASAVKILDSSGNFVSVSGNGNGDDGNDGGNGNGDDGSNGGDVEVVKVVEVVDGDGMSFPDAGLARVVGRALGATDLARSNETEVALLRGLNAARSGVADLAGLEIASGLKSLDLSGNRITNLTPLAALDGLTKLTLSGNPNLEDLAPLASLIRLGNLDLSSNRRITDLTPLSGLILLETLRLDGIGASDLTPLAGLIRLGTLSLSSNRQIVDLSPLSGLILLETLRLDRTGASDLTPLAGLTNLETLTLSSNRQIVDLSPLSGLTMLRTLRLDGVGAADLAPLSLLAELRTLSLSGNGVVDLSSLQTLLKLSVMHLGANRIEDVSPLAGLTELRSLSLNDNRITDVAALAALPWLASLNLNGNALSGFPSTGFRQLRGLYLRDCGVADIGALANLAQIETLFLDGNGISDLSPLSTLYGLTKLFLARNEITDLTPLSWLPALRQLVLDDNNIADVAALSSLSGLTKLFLARNEVSDLTPLAQLAELEQLTLDGNEVADVAALSGLRKLELLSLGQNQIADIAALAELPALDYLDLRGNPLDADALSVHIPALEERGVQVLY